MPTRKVIEMFGSGTAATVSPVGSILYNGATCSSLSSPSLSPLSFIQSSLQRAILPPRIHFCHFLLLMSARTYIHVYIYISMYAHICSYTDENLTVPLAEGDSGSIARRMMKELFDIQYGVVPSHPWAPIIASYWEVVVVWYSEEEKPRMSVASCWRATLNRERITGPTLNLFLFIQYALFFRCTILLLCLLWSLFFILFSIRRCGCSDLDFRWAIKSQAELLHFVSDHSIIWDR